MKTLLLVITTLLVFSSCKSISTCESLGLQTKSAILYVEKVNDSNREVVRYQCIPKPIRGF